MALLEVCAGSVEDACVAARCGANRVELCAALELGGLTPSLGVVHETLDAQPLPVIAMNRPRAGGFDYRAREFAAMLRDAAQLVAAGAHGVVFGVLRHDGAIDMDRCRALRDAIGAAEAVFHRAFDYVPDLDEALDQLIDLGVDRVLTSGGQPTALAGADVLARLVQRAAGRIQILPGGGIAAQHVRQLVAIVGCTQIHMGGAGQGADTSVDGNPALPLADLRWLAGGGYRQVDPARIEALVQQLA